MKRKDLQALTLVGLSRENPSCTTPQQLTLYHHYKQPNVVFLTIFSTLILFLPPSFLFSIYLFPSVLSCTFQLFFLSHSVLVFTVFPFFSNPLFFLNVKATLNMLNISWMWTVLFWMMFCRADFLERNLRSSWHRLSWRCFFFGDRTSVPLSS